MPQGRERLGFGPVMAGLDPAIPTGRPRWVLLPGQRAASIEVARSSPAMTWDTARSTDPPLTPTLSPRAGRGLG
jgi:hypothetical protein